jgi:type IV secretory pathway VirB2 component (pilin)
MNNHIGDLLAVIAILLFGILWLLGWIAWDVGKIRKGE